MHMTKREWIASGVLIALFLAVFITAMASRASAACYNSPVRTTVNMNYDGGEDNTNARFFIQVKKNCDGSYTERWGFYPNRDRNQRMGCGFGTNTQHITVNPSSVYGYDAPKTWFKCSAYGDSKSKRFYPRGTDRSFGGWVRAYKNIVVDPTAKLPTRYAQRRG